MTNPFVKYRASELILKQLRDEITQDEQKELDYWKSSHPGYKLLFEELTDEQMLAKDLNVLEGLNKRIKDRLVDKIPASSPVVPMRRGFYLRIAAAAAVILIIALGWFWISRSAGDDKRYDLVKYDVPAPDKTKAMITLSDGRSVAIDSLEFLTQGNVRLAKTGEGKIVYTGTANEIIYNTLTNPRGSKVIDMQLSDGSHVWLNAGSSVTYPIAFIGNERKVSINGEAYFEIITNYDLRGTIKIPFIVEKGEMQVKVLGTQFNV